MTNKIEKIGSDFGNTKFLIDGDEYMRVEGVWFKWNKYQVKYIPEDRPELEALYKETFGR
jgi:hypothetical protein